MPGALDSTGTQSRDPLCNLQRRSVQKGVLGKNVQTLAHLSGEAVGFYTGYNKEKVAQYLLVSQLLVT